MRNAMRDRRRIPFATAAIVVLAVLAVTGCVKVVNTGSFDRVHEAVVDKAYLNEAADFSRYTKLMAGGLEIYFPESETPPDPADIQRVREYFRTAFLQAIGDDYPIVTEPGPEVLLVKAQVIDMKLTEGGAVYEPDGKLRDIVAHGELTFLMTMSDSATGQVLARAGDKYSDISADRGEATWDDVRKAAEYWAGLFRGWLDRSLGEAGAGKKPT